MQGKLKKPKPEEDRKERWRLSLATRFKGFKEGKSHIKSTVQKREYK
jgi:hypothetical protein